MKTIHLYGFLADKFEPKYTLDVQTPAEAIRLLEANYPGQFANAMKDKWWRISRRATGPCMHECELHMPTAANEFHIEPITQGGFKAIFGLFLGGTGLGSIFTPLGLPVLGGGGAGVLGFGGALGGFGKIAIGLALLGVLALISGALSPKEEQKTEEDEKSSFLFNGPVNQSSQGGPVPVVYGRVIVGSTVISGGIKVEDISA
jgi:predicted phage tail protein